MRCIIPLIKSLPLAVIVLLLVACEAPKADGPTPLTLDIPKGFPPMNIPSDNPMTVEAVDLGRQLFFDPLLSKDYSISCASCHFPAYAFSDTVAVSPGVHEDRLGNRNAYPLANVGYLQALFMEGGVPSLELQVMAPMGETSEMDMPLHEAVERMRGNKTYVELSQKAYDREIDPWVVTRALAAYQRTLISGDSSFDHFLYHGEKDALSDDAKAGWKRFKAFGCYSCHSGPLLTDQRYYNIGLYSEYDDPGRGRLTDDPDDRGKFRVPSLRNVALTAPYMHDGSIKSLDEVIDHFALGGKVHINKSSLIKEFEIDEQGKRELIAFLESLTDSTFISNTDHLPVSLRS